METSIDNPDDVNSRDDIQQLQQLDDLIRLRGKELEERGKELDKQIEDLTKLAKNFLIKSTKNTPAPSSYNPDIYKRLIIEKKIDN